MAHSLKLHQMWLHRENYSPSGASDGHLAAGGNLSKRKTTTIIVVVVVHLLPLEQHQSPSDGQTTRNGRMHSKQ